MSLLRLVRLGIPALATSVIASCSDGADSLSPPTRRAAADASFTKGSGSQSTLLGRATFRDPKDPNFMVKRITGAWHVEVKAKPELDVAVQRITFDPGAQSGWHAHPGPVFIQVVKGTLNFYESDDPTCTPIVRKAGEGYLDVGDDAHIARNESDAPAETIVTYLVPPGVDLRIDKPRPGNCPF